ncbi:BrnT family toxin [Chloroflexi bacterium TSY]|nr:BrnT family toxin [Chloroflexi bacterium TSY]
MRIDDFIWLDDFVDKLEEKHGVYQDEVEDVFRNQPKIRKVQNGRVKGEDLYRALGQTENGRYLFIIFVYKPLKNSALVVSARDMSDKERKNYGK